MQNNIKIKNDPLYILLREGKIEDFNTLRGQGHGCDLTCCDFRGLNLRGLMAKGLDFSNSYFRQTDLRGVDLSESNMDGCSINGAKISGTLFPCELSADEITLSLLHGTRLRYKAP